MRRFRKTTLFVKTNGGITAFMCIAMSLIILFNTVLIDCARLLALDELLKRKVYFCADSLAADYLTDLQSGYGIYGLYLRDSDIRRNNAYKYLSENAVDISELFNSAVYRGYTDTGLFRYEIKDLKLTHIGCLSDPDILKDNICSLMRYKAPADILMKLSDKIGLFGESAALCEIQSMLSQAEDITDNIFLGMENVKTAIGGKDSSEINSVYGWSSLGKHFAETQLDLAEKTLLTAHSDSGAEILKKQFEVLRETLMIHKGYNTAAVTYINEILKLRDELKFKVSQIYDALDSLDYDVEQNLEYYRSIKENLNGLSDFADKISYTGALNILGKNVSLFDAAETACNMAISNLTSGNTDTNLLKEYIAIIKNVTGVVTDIQVADPEDVEIDTSYSDYDMTDTKDKYIGSVFSKETDIIIPDKKFSVLPSVENGKTESDGLSAVFDIFANMDTDSTDIETCENMSSAGVDFISSLDTAADSIYINEYIMSFFYCDSDTTPENRVFNAEIEYIIAGNPKQSENTDDVYSQIMAIRTIMNFMHILLDSTKMSFANQIGTSISSATMGIGAPIYTFLIIGIWAVAEAALDVLDLKEGESVPFYKEKGDWKLDIGLENIGSAFLDRLTDGQTESTVTEKDSLMNLTYKDYLNLLLLGIPEETKLMRICDLIELNLAESVTDDFNISDIYTGIACDLTISVKPLIDIGFFKKSRKGGLYELHFIGNSIY